MTSDDGLLSEPTTEVNGNGPWCKRVLTGHSPPPPNTHDQFVPELIRPLARLSGLARHMLLFVYFFKLLIPYIDKYHISAVNALITINEVLQWRNDFCQKIYFLRDSFLLTVNYRLALIATFASLKIYA